MSAEFVHLHNHSDYSLLDGAQTVQTLVNTIDDLISKSGYEYHEPNREFNEEDDENNDSFKSFS